MVSQIEIYKLDDNSPAVDVKIENDTIWLTQKEISSVFATQVPAINKHIRNIFTEGELKRKGTISKMEIVQREGNRMVKRKTEVYNLDVIISVGYRVNSGRATKFRQWATQRLKEHLVQGYTLNQKRLEQLQQVVNIIQQSDNKMLSASETKGLLEIITHYTQSFILLNRFDNNDLAEENLNKNITYEIEFPDAIKAIKELKKQLIKKKEASQLFGNKKDQQFEGILKSVVQTFDGKYLYPSIEEQAAHLLYFIIKNHPFVDGNKRIGAFLFIWFLEKNKHRFKKSGELKINDNALVALALLVAQSYPDDKEIMIKLIINLINNR